MKKSNCKFTACLAVSALCAASIGLASHAAPHRGGGGHGGSSAGGGGYHPVFQHHEEMMQQRRQNFHDAMAGNHGGQFNHDAMAGNHGGQFNHDAMAGNHGGQFNHDAMAGNHGGQFNHDGFDRHGFDHNEMARHEFDRHNFDRHNFDQHGWGDRNSAWNSRSHDSLPDHNGVQSFSWGSRAGEQITSPPPSISTPVLGISHGPANSSQWHAPVSGASAAGGQFPMHLSTTPVSKPSGFSIDGKPAGEGNWGKFADNHPRRAEVLSRDHNLNNDIQADKGNLGGNYNKLEREDQSIKQQEQADARINGGYITKGEQHQINREESSLNRQINRDDHPTTASSSPGGTGIGTAHGSTAGGTGVGTTAGSPAGSTAGGAAGATANAGQGHWQQFEDHHPRRAEVLSRDHNLNNDIQADKGNLGGNYNKLEREDQSIKQQEQADARINGGYITKGEQHQINREESSLHRQINRDDHPASATAPAGPSKLGNSGTGTAATGTASGSSGNASGTPTASSSGGTTTGSSSSTNRGGSSPTASAINSWQGWHWDRFRHEHRRGEVLSRDNRLNNEIQADKGNLGGNYNKLDQKDQAIMQQEQADAKLNGGYITRGEQHQLNREENSLQRQINRDDRPGNGFNSRTTAPSTSSGMSPTGSQSTNPGSRTPMGSTGGAGGAPAYSGTSTNSGASQPVVVSNGTGDGGNMSGDSDDNDNPADTAGLPKN